MSGGVQYRIQCASSLSIIRILILYNTVLYVFCASLSLSVSLRRQSSREIKKGVAPPPAPPPPRLFSAQRGDAAAATGLGAATGAGVNAGADADADAGNVAASAGVRGLQIRDPSSGSAVGSQTKQAYSPAVQHEYSI